MISTEKPGSPAELVHFGTKGMKWGVRKTQGTHDFYAKNPTPEARKAAITKARASAYKTKAAYKQEKRGSEKREQLKEAHKKNPNTATALRFTRGEKVVYGILAAQGYMPLLGLGVGIGLTSNVGKRRAIEK